MGGIFSDRSPTPLNAYKQTLQKFLVVDDHEAILQGTIPALKEKYPEAEILAAQDAQTAYQQFERHHPDLLIVDLCLPEKPQGQAQIEVGMQLLKSLMSSPLAPNLVVLSTNVKPLVRLKPIINTYEGGFAAMDKSLPFREMLKLVDLALRGSIYLSSELRSRPEFDRKWLEVLTLKYQEGLTDKANRPKNEPERSHCPKLLD
ncbi:response regulator [Nostoc sphaeroides CHAB 2801]|uniref:response regulator n=1 Tax=Nostoc sphaeroides TaxID=446679 RepID=UPI001E2D5D92|nr:response regulator [Nostoc sphaeroides]MCC5632170.1 response regulator [Nostoc sphaeroides CHAB 2801]